MAIETVLDALNQHCDEKENVFLGDMCDTLKTEAFGLLIFFPALISFLPLGFLPGVPAICAVFIMLSAVHILLGRSHLWLPQGVRKISVSTGKMSSFLGSLGAWGRRLERLSKQRCNWLTVSFSLKLTSIVVFLLAVASLIFSFVPFLGLVLMLPLAFFGAGICMRDGLAIGLGWGVLGTCGLTALIV